MRGTILWIALLSTGLIAGCGGKPNNPVVPPTGSVAVTPSLATVLVHGSLSLSATVANLSDSRVTWRLARQSPTPDTADVGQINPTGPSSADYTAPSTVSGTFDYKVSVTAVSVADTNVKGTAVLTIPRVTLSITPGNLSSVPPGSLVPYAVVVTNTPNPAYSLYVNGIPGGNASIGTWTQTGISTTVYQAPGAQTLTQLYELFARSADDPKRFGSATITVRRGVALPVRNPDLSQYAPEWHPGLDQLAFVEGGPPWELAIWDSTASQIRNVTSLTWSGATYDGRVSWSPSGIRLAASEESGVRRVIAVVNVDGTGRKTFAPDADTDYWEAAFLPTVAPGGPDTLVVAQTNAAGSSIRAYPADAGPGDPGRLIYSASAGSSVRWPDAIRVGSGAPLVAFEQSFSGSSSSVLSLVDDGSGDPGLTAASGSGRRTQVRWATNSDVGALWITFISSDIQTAYRVNRSNPSSLRRLYTDFFPELSGDVGSALGGPMGASPDLHALARVHPDGKARIWLVEFPAFNFPGVSRAEELELASIGARGALSPWRWRIWLQRP